MKNRLTLLLLLFGLVGWMPEADAADYFWVGNGGLWNDITHWSTVSGSTLEADRHSELPGPDDNVIFNAGSFDMNNQFVQLVAGDNDCYNMSWTGVTNNPTLRFPNSAANLNVYYKLDLDDNMSVDYSFAPQLAQINMLNTGVDISGFIAAVATRGKTLPNIHFAGVGGNWSITNTLNVEGELKISAGLLQSGSPSTTTFDVTAEEVIVDGANVVLYLERLNITAETKFSVLDVNSIRYTNRSMGVDYVSTISTPLFEISSSNATDFGNVNVTGTDGIVSASGFSLNFHGNLSLNGTQTNTILGSHTISTALILNVPGSINKLEAGSTQTFANQATLIGTGANCSNYFFLKSTVDGSATFIDKPGGPTISLQRFYFQDIHAVPLNRFSVSLSIDLGNNVNLNFPVGTPSSLNFYWVNGSGDWSDGNHWMIEGGGTGCLPTANDNVFFNDASFTANNQIVNVDLPAIYFNNITWDVTQNQNWNVHSADIFTGGSMSLDDNLNISLISPTFHFTSSSTGNTIDAGITATTGHDLGNVTFESSTGGWTLISSLIVSGDIVITDGTFATGSNRVEAEMIHIDGSADVTLGEVVITKTFEIASIGSLTSTETNNIYTTTFDITPSGLSFNQLILQDSDDSPAETEGILRGDNLQFVDVNLNNSTKSTVYGSHSYSNLLQLSKIGMIAEFEAGSTQTMNRLATTATDCGGEIFLRSTMSGTQVNFVNTSLTPSSVSNLLIQDNAASPIASFVASNSLNLGNNSGWSFISIGGTISEFYWIGGAGNWSDGNNWSDESGGMAINCVPTPSDNVTFDENSFDGDGQIVTLDGDEQYCRNMIWTNGVTGVPILQLPAGNELFVYGSFILTATPLMQLNFEDGSNAAIHFKATSDNNFSIAISGHSISNLEFDGPGGSWNLGTISTPGDEESVLVDKISLMNGELSIGSSIYVNQFLIDGINTAVNIQTPSITAIQKFDVNQIDPANFDAGTSTINTNILESDIDGITFYQVDLVDDPDNEDASPALNGNNLIFNTLALRGTLENFVFGSHRFNQALLFHVQNALGFFYFESGSTQTLGADAMLLRTSDIANSPAFVEATADADATFFKESGLTCTDYLRITDINATPANAFGLINGTSSVTSATGWIFTDLSCEAFLPVDCIDFAAAVQTDNSVELYWITAQEVNNDGFEVQRSTNGRSFETIAWIDGAGTTSEAQKYTFVDSRTDGLTEAYYRIRQIDFDGTAAFACDIQAVNFRAVGSGPVQVFPNPAGSQVQVRWYGRKDGTTIIRLFDQSGRLVLDREWNTLEGNNQRELPINELPQGIYELQVVSEHGLVETARLIKQ